MVSSSQYFFIGAEDTEKNMSRVVLCHWPRVVHFHSPKAITWRSNTPMVLFWSSRPTHRRAWSGSTQGNNRVCADNLSQVFTLPQGDWLPERLWRIMRPCAKRAEPRANLWRSVHLYQQAAWPHEAVALATGRLCIILQAVGKGNYRPAFTESWQHILPDKLCWSCVDDRGHFGREAGA